MYPRLGDPRLGDLGVITHHPTLPNFVATYKDYYSR